MSENEENENELYMDDNTWDSRISKVQTWKKEHRELIKTDEDIADSVDIINMNIKRGAKRPNMRKKYWSSILLEGRNHPEWPIKKGKESNLPQNVQASLTTLGTEVLEVYTNFWNENELIQNITVISDRNKELGGSPYESGEAFAKGRVLAVRQRFTKYFTTGRWNGEFVLEDGFGITAPPPEETETDDSGDTDES
jgi:hypothetical protein